MGNITRIPKTSFVRQRWANGKGETLELAAGPDRQHWSWRISMATVAEDGPFSRFEGVARQLTTLDAGIALTFANGEHMAASRLEVMTFSGARPVTCHLPDGPTRDLNLMLRDPWRGELRTWQLSGMQVVPDAAGRVFVLQLAGQCSVTCGASKVMLASGDAAWVDVATNDTLTLDGRGEMATVRLQV